MHDDVRGVTDFLQARFGGRAELGPDLPQGEWSRAYAFALDGGDHVVRFSRSPETFDLDRMAMSFASASLPIPSVTEVGEAPGGYYAISERASGVFLEELAAPDLDLAFPSLLATLDAMRLADTSGSKGFGPWDATGDGCYEAWADYLLDVQGLAPPGAEGWRQELDASPVARSAFEDGARALAGLVPSCPNLRSLVHSDLLNRNVFVADHRISALIDWQCAMYGDFLYDLAWFTFWAPWHPGHARVDFRRLVLEHHTAAGRELPDFAARMRCYEIHIGLRSLAYQAWRKHPALEATAVRTREVTGSAAR
jgi:hygromycin-B 4-O-kinase